MANYPTSLDSFTNPTGVDSLSSPSHSLQHADANDAIEALEAKLGIGNSPAGSATAGRVLVASTGGSTSWTTVSAGAVSTTGGSAGQVLTAGTAGVAEWAYSGLTLVKTQTIGTAVSSVTVSDAFSATYDAYFITINGGTCSATNNFVLLQLGSSTTTYYYASTGALYSGSVNTGAVSNGSNIRVGTLHTSGIEMACTILSPYLSKYTFVTADYIATDVAGRTSGIHQTASSYTAFTLTAAAGTMTGGEIRVYGYRNS